MVCKECNKLVEKNWKFCQCCGSEIVYAENLNIKKDNKKSLIILGILIFFNVVSAIIDCVGITFGFGYLNILWMLYDLIWNVKSVIYYPIIGIVGYDVNILGYWVSTLCLIPTVISILIIIYINKLYKKDLISKKYFKISLFLNLFVILLYNLIDIICY